MFIAQNTEISPNFLLWKLRGNTQSRLSFARSFVILWTFPQNPHTRKLGKISVFYTVNAIEQAEKMPKFYKHCLNRVVANMKRGKAHVPLPFLPVH